MSIYISATSIKDYISCSKKLYWRTNFPEHGVESEYMHVGTVVHTAIEKFSNKSDRQEAFDYINKNIPNRKDSSYGISCYDNFLDYFAPLLTPEDEIETKFKIFLGNDTYLVGKIDRISNGVVYDWKTARKPPKNIDKDIQFMIYYLAYTSIYGKAPNAVMYGALKDGTLIKYTPSSLLLGLLENEVIPQVVSALKTGTFYKQGVFGSSTCHNCMYEKVCTGGI